MCVNAPKEVSSTTFQFQKYVQQNILKKMKGKRKKKKSSNIALPLQHFILEGKLSFQDLDDPSLLALYKVLKGLYRYPNQPTTQPSTASSTSRSSDWPGSDSLEVI